MIKNSFYGGTFSHMYRKFPEDLGNIMIEEEKHQPNELDIFNSSSSRQNDFTFDKNQNLPYFPMSNTTTNERNAQKYKEEFDKINQAYLKTKSELDELREKGQKALNDQKNEISILSTKNKDLESISNDLRSKLNSQDMQYKNQLAIEKANYEKNIDKLEKEIINKGLSTEVHNAKINELKNEYENKIKNANIKTRDEYAKTIKNLEAKIQELNNTSSNLNSSIFEKEEEITKYVNELAGINSAKNLLEQKVESLNANIKSLNSKIAVQNENIKNNINKSTSDPTLRNQLMELSKENDDLNNKLSIALSDLAEAKNTITTTQDMFKIKENKINSLQKTIDELIKKQEINQKNQGELGINQNNEFTEEKHRLTIQISELKNKINELDLEKTQLFNSNSSLKTQLTVAENSHANAIASSKEAYDRLSKQLTDLITKESLSKSTISGEALAKISEITAEMQIKDANLTVEKVNKSIAENANTVLKQTLINQDLISNQLVTVLEGKFESVSNELVQKAIEKETISQELVMQKVTTRNIQHMGNLLVEYMKRSQTQNMSLYGEVCDRLAIANNNNINLLTKINAAALTNEQKQVFEQRVNAVESSRENIALIVQPLAIENINVNEIINEEEQKGGASQEEEKKIETVMEKVMQETKTQEQISQDLAEFERISKANEQSEVKYTGELQRQAISLYRKVQQTLNIAIQSKKALFEFYNPIWIVLQRWYYSYQFYMTFTSTQKNSALELCETVSLLFGKTKELKFAYDLIEDMTIGFEQWQNYSVALFNKLHYDVNDYEQRYQNLTQTILEEMREASVKVQNFETLAASGIENDQFLKEKKQILSGPFVQNVKTVYNRINEISSSIAQNASNIGSFFKTNETFIGELFDKQIIDSFLNVQIPMNIILPTVLPYFNSINMIAGKSQINLLDEFLKACGWDVKSIEERNNDTLFAKYYTNENGLVSNASYYDKLKDIYNATYKCGLIPLISLMKNTVLSLFLSTEKMIDITIKNEHLMILDMFFSNFSKKIIYNKNFTNYIQNSSSKYEQDVELDKDFLKNNEIPRKTMILYIANLLNNCNFILKEYAKNGIYSIALEMQENLWTDGNNLINSLNNSQDSMNLYECMTSFKNTLFYCITNLSTGDGRSVFYQNSGEIGLGAAKILNQIDRNMKFNTQTNIKNNGVQKEFENNLQNFNSNFILSCCLIYNSKSSQPRIFNFFKDQKQSYGTNIFDVWKDFTMNATNFRGILNHAPKFVGNEKLQFEKLLQGSFRSQILESNGFDGIFLSTIYKFMNLKIDQDVKSQLNDGFLQKFEQVQTKIYKEKIDEDSSIKKKENWVQNDTTVPVYTLRQAKKEFLAYMKSDDGKNLRLKMYQYFTKYESEIKPVIEKNLQYEASVENEFAQVLENQTVINVV